MIWEFRNGKESTVRAAERPASGGHTTTGSTISCILDPDGNRMEISQRPDLVAAAVAAATAAKDCV